MTEPIGSNIIECFNREQIFLSVIASASELPGVDVMIIIFCDFRQFSVKKMAFFSKTNVMIIFSKN
jgi:hypothetical protein